MNSSMTAKRVINEEANALKILESELPKDFSAVVDSILRITGRVIIVGIGKSGYNCDLKLAFKDLFFKNLEFNKKNNILSGA